jgi:hypothetical protein
MVVSAVCAVMVGQMAWHDPRYLLPFAAITVMTLLPGIRARRRMKELLISGDVKRVLGTWEGSIDRVTYPETMAPLMAATAYAAYGWIEPARRALEGAVKGPAWEAALEQRLFVEALLDTFEGEKGLSIQKAEALERLPMPRSGPFARVRIARLRRGVAAMARAFAHTAQRADEGVLRAAASASPLIHWAMRYALAIVAVDRGDKDEAHKLLFGAPEWPRQSAFKSFHDELTAQLEPGRA